MRLWVKFVLFVYVDFVELEYKIFYWCLKEKFVCLYLYKYFVVCLCLFEGSFYSYSEIMRNVKDDFNLVIKVINCFDVG